MHLLLELDMVKMMQNMVDRKFNALKDAMIRDGIRFVGLDKKETSISVSLPAEQKEKFYNLVGKEFADLKAGGTNAEGDTLHVELLLPEKELANLKDNAVRQALETIRNRIDQFGVSEPVIVKQGENQILVQLPGIKDPQRALELIGRTAQLEFKLVDEENAGRATAGSVPEGDELLTMRTRNRDTGIATTTPILMKKQTLLTGELLTDARVSIGGEFGSEPYVGIEFDSEGARIFDKITAENVGKRIAIILDNTVYSAPVVRERISGGKASITGGFTMEEAKDLAIVLRAGALPAPVKVVQNITIGPTLGQDSINKGIRATILGSIITLTPGTLTVDIDMDRRVVHIHGLDVPDATDRERRDEIGRDVDGDDGRRTHDSQQRAADRRRGDHRNRLRGLELGVALDHLLLRVEGPVALEAGTVGLEKVLPEHLRLCGMVEERAVAVHHPGIPAGTGLDRQQIFLGDAVHGQHGK
ncbi:MAG: hypothetical protein HGA55_04715, partial [Methanoregulaceae archaeon]|nr:hypothetical protein [Methanoregulaceae archaeon]